MEYSINTENRTIYAQFSGPVSSNSLIQNILTIRADSHFQDGFNIIVDFRRSFVPKGYMELAELAEFVKVTSVVRETFRLAILVENQEQMRSAKLYALLVKHNSIKVCQCAKAAEKWATYREHDYENS